MANISRFFPLLVAIFASENCFAWEIDGGVLIKDISYEELGSNGDQVLEEYGLLPGAYVQLKHSIAGFSAESGIARSQGSGDYTGATQSGTPLQTSTYERYQSYWLSGQYTWQRKNIFISTGLGAKFWSWDRDIKATPETSSLVGKYRWDEYNVALSIRYENEIGEFEASYEYLLIRDGTVEVDLSILGIGTPLLDLGDDLGGRVELSYARPVSDQTNIKFSISYEEWGFEESNSLRISSFLIQEPKSNTRLYTTSLALGYKF